MSIILKPNAIHYKDNEGNYVSGNIVAEVQTEEVLNQWLNDHPEATTTVQDGAISTQKLHDNAVTTSKIQNSAVTAQKIQNSVVTETKIQNGAVSEQKLDTTLQNIINDVPVLSRQMASFVRLEDGSTTGDAELQDIRIGANNIDYATAGDAVRGQYNTLTQ